MLGLVESSGSETFPVRRPTRLGGSFPPDGRVSVSSCDGEQGGVVDLWRFEGFERSSLYVIILLGDWGVLDGGNGDLGRLWSGDLGHLSRL